MAKRCGVNVGISATLTPEIVDNFNEVLEFFVEIVGAGNGMGFNMLHYNSRAKTSDEYFAKAADCLIETYERFRELGIYEERFMRKVDAFINCEPIFVDCGVSGGQIVVAPDGRVGVCQDFVKPRKYFGGSVLDPSYDPFKEGLFDGWCKRSPLYMNECLGCEAIAICGGGCPASIEIQSGSRWNIDRRVCPHSKSALRWLVWDLYSQLDSK